MIKDNFEKNSSSNYRINSSFKTFIKSVKSELKDEFDIHTIDDICSQATIAYMDSKSIDFNDEQAIVVSREVVRLELENINNAREELLGERRLRSIAIRENCDPNDFGANKSCNLFLNEFYNLNIKEQGMIMGRLFKQSMNKEDFLEYTDVVHKITERIAEVDSELANLVYDRLCVIENPTK